MPTGNKNIKYTITVDEKGAIRSIDKFQKSATTSADKVTTRFKNLDRAIKATVVGSLVGLSAGFVALAKKTVDYGDKLEKLNRRLGIGAQEMDKLRKIADLSGISFNTLTMALQRAQRRIAEAAQGTGVAKDALEELGLSAAELAKLPLEQQFMKIAQAIDQLENSGDKTRLTMKLMDSEGVSLIQMFGSLEEAMKKTNSEWSDEKARQAAEFNDQITLLKHTFEDFAVNVIPALIKMIKALQRAWEVYQRALDWLYGSTEDAQVQLLKQYNESITQLEKQLKTLYSIADRINYPNPDEHPRIKQVKRELQLVKDLKKAYQETLAEQGKRDPETGQPLADAYGINRQSVGGMIIDPGGTGAGKGGKGASVDDWSPGAPASGDGGYDLDAYYGDVQAYIDEINTARNNEKLLLESNIDLQNRMAEAVEDTYDVDAGEMTDGLEEVEQKMIDIAEIADSAANSFSSGFANAFMDFADGTQDAETAFRSFAATFLRQIAQMIIQQTILNAIQNSSMYGSFFASAKGNVFNNGNVEAFADGGVVAGPTIFPMKGNRTGLMGEAGPEAIMPLKRTSQGKLGVVATGNQANSITFQNNINIENGDSLSDPAEANRIFNELTIMMREQARSVLDEETRVGGRLNTSINRRVI